MNQEKQGCNICPRECNIDKKNVMTHLNHFQKQLKKGE